MNRLIKIIAVFLIGLSSGCGEQQSSVVVSDVLGYVDIDTSHVFDDRAPRVAFDGTNYLAVYQGLNLFIVSPLSVGHEITGVLVSPDSALGAGIPFVVDIDISTNDDLAPDVAFDGTNYLVVYQRLPLGGTTHSIMGVLVNKSGGVVGIPFVIDGSADNIAPSVTFDKTNSAYLVVYQQTKAGTNHDIIGALVSTSGTVQAGSPFPIDNSINDDLVPAVSSDGKDYLVVYEQVSSSVDHDIIGARVDSTGTVFGPFDIDISPNDDRIPQIAFDGRNYLVVYDETVSSTNHDIIGKRVTPEGNVLDVVLVDTSNSDDRMPRLAFDGTNYLVVYQETFSSTDHDIIGARVDPEGNVLDYVFIDTSSFDDIAPAVAFGTTEYLVAYEEIPPLPRKDHDIIGALVTP